MKYEHDISLNFTLISDNEEPTAQEIRERLRQVVNDNVNLMDRIEIFNSEVKE